MEDTFEIELDVVSEARSQGKSGYRGYRARNAKRDIADTRTTADQVRASSVEASNTHIFLNKNS